MLELLGSPTINREDYNLRDLSEYDPSMRESARASAGSNYALNAMLGLGLDRAKLAELGSTEDIYQTNAMGQQELVSKGLDPQDPRARRLQLDEANQQGESLGLRFSEPPTQAQFDYLKEQKQAENSRDETLSRVPTLSLRGGMDFIAGFAASAIDPVNIATAFIPVIGEARYGRMVTRLGTGGARLAKGAAEGGVGTALTVPFVYAQAQTLQRNYDISSAFQDVVFGATLGAGLHWGGGAIGDAIRWRAQSNMDRLVRDITRDAEKRFTGEVLDRRKVRVQEGENSSIVESMDRNTRAETMRAAVRAVETDQVPKIDTLLKTSPELGELAVPDKRFPATMRLRNDVTASDFATGTRGAEVLNHVAERIAKTPQGLYDTFAARYKKLQDFSFKHMPREQFEAEARGLVEHPDQMAAVDTGSKTILVAEGAPLGAVRHEIERAVDTAYGETGDKAGGYRYRAKDADGQVGHRAALKQHYEEFPDRAPRTMQPKEAVDLFSRRDEPILGHQGPADADRAWDVVQDGKDKDLERMIADEEIGVIEDIANNITGAARDLGIMDKVIPMEERQILLQAAANQGKQAAVKDLFSAVDAAVERKVKTEALEDAEILMRGGADALKRVIIEGESVDKVIADVRTEKPELVTRAQALRSINLFQKSSDAPLTGAALDRAVARIQSGEDIDVAVQGAGLLARADEAAQTATGPAAELKAPGEDKADQSIEDMFGDLGDEAAELLKGIIAKRELAEAEARLVTEEHDLLAANPKTADLSSSMERTEFDEAQRDRAFREGSGTLVSSERGGAGGGRPGDTIEDGLFATRTRRDGEAVGGQSPAIEREARTAGGERSAPETAISYGAGSVPRRIITPDSSIEVSVEPKFVELEDLIHATGDLQVRDRSRAESQIEAFERAIKLDPEQLMPNRVADAGAPIVIANPAGGYTIVSGNGRVLSLRQVYGDETLTWKANQYRDRLGPAADGYRRPVLVSVITDNLSEAELVKFAERANRSRTAHMSVTEKAQRDAQAAGIDLMMLYQGGDFMNKENQPFFRAFMRKVATPQEMGEMSKNGVLTKTGLDRLNAAVLDSAYDDTGVLSLMLESTDNNIKSISSAYRDAAPVFMKLRAEIANGLVREEMDITPFMMEAARFVNDARDRGIKISNALAQVDAFNPMDPVVDRLIRQFYNPELTRANSALRISENLRLYAEAAREKKLGGFFEDNTTPLDVMSAAERQLARGADETLLAADEANAGPSPDGTGREVPQPAPPESRQVAGLRGQDASQAEAARPAAEAVTGLDRQIHDAYGSLAKMPSDWVSLTELRKKLGGSRAEQDAALKRMFLERAINLSTDDDSGSLTKADRAASLRIGMSDMHLVSIQSLAQPAPAAPRAAASGLRSLSEADLRAKLDAMKVPEIRALLKAEGIEAKGRSKEQIINAAVEAVKKPAKAAVTPAAEPARKPVEPGQNKEYRDLLTFNAWENVINDKDGLFRLIREDGESVLKRLPDGRDRVIVERLIKKSHETEALVRDHKFDDANEMLSDMLDDAERLTDKATVIRQWVRAAARERNITKIGDEPAASGAQRQELAVSPHREAFYDYLESKEPVKSAANISKRMGISQEAAYTLLDEAVERGWLKINAVDLYIRVPERDRPPRPGPLDEVPSAMGDVIDWRKNDNAIRAALVSWDKSPVAKDLVSKLADLEQRLSDIEGDISDLEGSEEFVNRRKIQILQREHSDIEDQHRNIDKQYEAEKLKFMSDLGFSNPSHADAPKGWDVVEPEITKMERDLQATLAITRAVSNALHRVPDVIKFEIMDRLQMGSSGEAAGVYLSNQHLIALARNMRRDTVETVNHEIFHALRNLKLFTDYEWTIIKNTYEAANGIEPARQSLYRAYWEEATRQRNLDPESLKMKLLIDDKLAEEWAATDFGEWSKKRSAERETAIGRLWGRAKDFMQDLTRSFDNFASRSMGMPERISAQDIFRSIEDGTVASRWQEWGMNRGDATNPMSVKSMAIDDHTKMLNDAMRAIAQDEHSKLGRLQEEVLKNLAPCAAYNL
jgi:hypothetical protein